LRDFHETSNVSFKGPRRSPTPPPLVLRHPRSSRVQRFNPYGPTREERRAAETPPSRKPSFEERRRPIRPRHRSPTPRPPTPVTLDNISPRRSVEGATTTLQETGQSRPLRVQPMRICRHLGSYKY
jgi:hypothetical protein